MKTQSLVFGLIFGIISICCAIVAFNGTPYHYFTSGICGLLAFALIREASQKTKPQKSTKS